ncbi:MAG: hypothetical protein LLF89_03910 [Spirochaetaceae bacterium]|nr:hypothetical protein [Spirochaetaceae bacterium]
MEGFIEYIVDFRVLIGAVIGAAVMIPVVVNNPQWFSSRLAAIKKAGEDAIEKAKKSDEMATFIEELKKRGVIKE